MKGIDVSNWQEDLNLSKLDIDFCICKATEGNYFIDFTCDEFIQACIKKKIPYGFYHFAGNNEPEEEAEFFYNNCLGYFNKGIPVLDYEVENYNNRKWCERFIKKLHELSGIWCMLYISASRCDDYDGSWIPEKCGLWLAGYPHESNYWPDYDMPYDVYPWKFAAIWQFTSQLVLQGYIGRLDGDIAYMDKNGWNKYAQSTDNPQKVEKPKKTIDDLVKETLLGEYGSGEDRKRMLGSNYEEVQNKINKYYEIADEVIDGKWGNGWNRKTALKGAGYPYEIIQKIVNEKLA